MTNQSFSSGVKLSIITAVLNAREGLQRTLTSVAKQHTIDIEHIVVDGGSVDGSRELAESWAAHPLLILSSGDSGIWNAFNQGLRAASGEYVAFLNADDVYCDGAIARVVRDMENTDVTQCCICDILSNGAVLRTRVPRWSFFWALNSHLCHPSTFVRRSIYVGLNGFDERWSRSADLDLFLRIRKLQGLRYKKCNYVTTMMRIGGFSQKGILNFDNFWVVRKNISIVAGFITIAIQGMYCLKRKLLK